MTSDVLIIGGGVTARRAAAILAEKYSVILLSDGAGASPYIHGLNVPLHESDSAELFLKDTLESGKYQNDRALARALVKGSFDVIKELGDSFDKRPDGSFDLLKPLGSSVPRVAGIGGRTGALILKELRENKKYKELSSHRAVRLLSDKGGVFGALCFDKTKNSFFKISAAATLISSGGFGGIFPFSTNSPDIGGDGCAMAYLAGADIVDMEFIQYEPTVAISPDKIVGKSIITTMLFEGAVIRNKDGERFMDERVGKDALSEGIYREILRGGKTEGGGVYFDMTGVPEEMLLGKYRDYFERYKKVGVDIRKTPVEICPAPHTTMGGIKIDERARTSINGLFAAGEAAGGVHGANRLGGNAGLEVLVFGDIAGRSISEFLEKKLDTGRHLSENSPEDYIPDVPFDASAGRSLLNKILASSLGVIKDGAALECALCEAEKILLSAAEHPTSYEAIRLYNDTLTASLVIKAALSRLGSVGSHIRADTSYEGAEKYRLVHRKSANAPVKEALI